MQALKLAAQEKNALIRTNCKSHIAKLIEKNLIYTSCEK